MQGIIERVSVSQGGIPKHAVELGRVGELGIEGDSCRNRKYHGGPMQALLLITSEGLEELRALGFPLFAGSLGENLTTRGLDRRSMRIGQRYRSGSVEIELTKLRVPCSTLDPYGRGVQKALYDKRVKAGDFESPRWGYGGFYARVIHGGDIYPGAIIALSDPAV